MDYIKLQAMGNYKTPASATACYLAARKKMLADNGKMTDNDRKLIVMAWYALLRIDFLMSVRHR